MLRLRNRINKSSLLALALAALFVCLFLLVKIGGGSFLIYTAKNADARSESLFFYEGSPLFSLISKNDLHHSLEWAFAKKNLPLARRILRMDIDINPSSKFAPPLYSAAVAGDIESVLFLLGKGADIDSSNQEFTRYPLMGAVAGNNLEMVKLLLSHGANPNRKHHAFSPVMWAQKHGYEEISRALIQAGAKVERWPASLQVTNKVQGPN